MSFTVHARDGQCPAAAPSLLAVCIAFALAPAATFAATPDTTSGDTVIVDGSAASSYADEESQDYSVKTTTSGTKMLLVPRDIPQSVSIISKQRMQDQKLESLGDVLKNTTGITQSATDSERTNFYSRGFEIDNFMVTVFRPCLRPAGIWVTPSPIPPCMNVLKWFAVPTA